MATIDDVATNEDMVTIANAIRRVTRTTSGMNIPQMSERLLDIRTLVTTSIEVNLSTGTSVSLGTYDKTLKHLFMVTPLANADAKKLAKVKPELQLSYDATTGVLSMSYTVASADATSVHLKVLDFLLATDDTTAGLLVNQSTGGAGIAEAYDSTKSYEVGETFIYNSSLGVTLTAHAAEAYTQSHNILLANQVYVDLAYKDLSYYAGQLATKLDKTSVKTAYDDSDETTYSTKYSNQAFAPLSLAQPFYAHKVDGESADLEKTAPTPSAANTLTVNGVGTDYDWNNPAFEFTRELETGVTINSTNRFRIALPFRIDANADLSFGAKVRVSTDNGATWQYISTNLAFGAESFTSAQGNTVVLDTPFDALQGLATYQAGTLICVEIYIKQAVAQALVVTAYCGVTVDGAAINTTVEFVVANVNIDTAQIEDGAVTYAKLADQVKAKLDNSLQKPATTPASDTITYIDSQNTQHFATLDDNIIIESGVLKAGIIVTEVL